MSVGDNRVYAFIPARLGSTRMARKALAADTGKPMVQHVYEAAARAALADEVIVATEADEVVRAVEAFGGRAILTSPDHPNGASRIAEACDKLGVAEDALVLNVQGDEPEIEPGTIDAAAAALAESDAPVATVASPMLPGDDPTDPNMVKVVLNRRGEALYFSRSLIPFDRDGLGVCPPLKHVGLYAFRRPYLRVYADLEPTPLEESERLEQLRILENGGRIAVAIRPCRNAGIDTPEQYAAFVARYMARQTVA